MITEGEDEKSNDNEVPWSGISFHFYDHFPRETSFLFYGCMLRYFDHLVTQNVTSPADLTRSYIQLDCSSKLGISFFGNDIGAALMFLGPNQSQDLKSLLGLQARIQIPPAAKQIQRWCRNTLLV